GGGSAGAGAGSFGCNPVCVAPQTCSAAGTCIDPGKCAVASDCSAGMKCDGATKTCVPGGDCGTQEAKVETIPPNMLLVLDRSCSMTALVGNVTKWDIAVAAINKMTTDYTGKIRFGLTLFPDLVTPNCQQAAIPIPVGPDNETAIQELLTAALVKADKYFPDGPCVTNIQTAVTQSTTEPAFNNTDRDSYAVLITDGKETCGSDATTEMEIKNLFETRGIPTFVIGFGAGIDPAQMNKFASAGGVPAAGANQYYDASDQASLELALATIAKKTLSCAYTLDTVPPNPSEIYVFFDNTTEVSRDDTKTDGWTYDAGKNQVVFYGPACDSLKNGVVMDLDIVLGCQEPTPN
ncbi:MAG TPA: VWA domain-containing protein, partial [Polyangium sp.]|nr:VWA domain-containing protein [Polyangium sp.]